MNAPLLRARPADTLRPLTRAAQHILSLQRNDGAIPWFDEGPWDPWNHAESLMALTVMGEEDAARHAFEHLAASQERAGSWLSGYGNALPFADRDHIARVEAPAVRDTNFAAYPATALWHHWLAWGDIALVRRFWPMARAGIDFALSCQNAEGDISWAAEARGTTLDDAVLPGNASIYKSIGHALQLADMLNDPQPHWWQSRARLRHAMRQRPDRFDRATMDRSSFAMDWYYPVLAGALPIAAGRARLVEGGRRWIEIGRGCRCVASEPWATVAESAELAITLAGLGLRRQAATLLGWQDKHRDSDGVYWMGWQFAEDIAWPLEKPGWTQAAVILAQDAIHGITPASTVLSGR